MRNKVFSKMFCLLLAFGIVSAVLTSCNGGSGNNVGSSGCEDELLAKVSKDRKLGCINQKGYVDDFVNVKNGRRK